MSVVRMAMCIFRSVSVHQIYVHLVLRRVGGMRYAFENFKLHQILVC